VVSEFGYAWSKLYLAIMTMATSTEPMPERVRSAYYALLIELDCQNLPPFGYERLNAVRARLAQLPEGRLANDVTVDVAPLSVREAVLVAEEIISLFDEIARTDARSRVTARSVV
jgi:hypothetical protein